MSPRRLRVIKLERDVEALRIATRLLVAERDAARHVSAEYERDNLELIDRWHTAERIGNEALDELEVARGEIRRLRDLLDPSGGSERLLQRALSEPVGES